jgi:transglutaminase-like putative cysteine protease
METDAAGNQRLLISLENIPPYGSKTVVVNAEISMAQAPNRLNESISEQYLKAAPYIEVDDPAIQRIAQTLKGNTALETLEKTFQWVTRHLENVEYVKRDRGALYALQHRRADCTGYMYLFTALARANSIYARPVAGFVYAEDTIAKSRDYHNWVEVYVDHVWRVVDPQKQRFMENENHYIAMRLLDSLNEQTAGSAQRLFRSDGAVQLAMK